MVGFGFVFARVAVGIADGGVGAAAPGGRAGKAERGETGDEGVTVSAEGGFE